jgi:hypothetical protein
MARRPDPVRGRSVRILGAVLLPAATSLTACSGPAAPPSASSTPSPSSPAGATPVEEAEPTSAEARACLEATGGAPWHGLRRVEGDQVTVEAHDDYFSPSCLVVPAGRAVTVVLTDRGSVPHNLIDDGSAVAASVDSGQTAFVALPAVERPMSLVCTIHEDERMLLAVVPGEGDGV